MGQGHPHGGDAQPRLDQSDAVVRLFGCGDMGRAILNRDWSGTGLGPIDWADIKIKLFRVEIDGTTFGMVDVSEPDEGPEWADRVSMVPGDLLFTAPWDGNYCT